jgi:hypothetical protein
VTPQSDPGEPKPEPRSTHEREVFDPYPDRAAYSLRSCSATIPHFSWAMSRARDSHARNNRQRIQQLVLTGKQYRPVVADTVSVERSLPSTEVPAYAALCVGLALRECLAALWLAFAAEHPRTMLEECPAYFAQSNGGLFRLS